MFYFIIIIFQREVNISEQVLIYGNLLLQFFF